MPLAAGTCRTGLTGVPEVLFSGQTHNVARVHSDLLSQNIECLIVLLPNGDPHAIAVKAILAFRLRTSEQIPREVNSAFFEVITEGEITIHLEEGTVTGRATDVVDIVRTNALLNGCSPGPRSRFNTGDVRNEGHHTSDGEQNRRLRRHQRNGWTNLVSLRCKVVKPTLTNFRSAHSTPY